MIFVDTWAWVGMAVKRDQYHALVMKTHSQLRKARRKYVTSDYILSELITYLYAVAPVPTAERFINSLLSNVDAGRCDLVTISAAQFRRAWQLRQKYHDKPDISFVDFTSMVVMQDLGISEVFAGDAHFEQVGLGLQLVPRP